MEGVNAIAYVDGANLHNAVRSLPWEFDYQRFRIWLREKYHVGIAYIFLGYIAANADLYERLRAWGFEIVFKEVVYQRGGKAKGNCDADIVVHAMPEAYEGDITDIVLVSSDGDYAPLVAFLLQKGKFNTVISPYQTSKCSVLLKRTGAKISYISDQQTILQIQKEKAPSGDDTPQGSSS